MFTSDANQCFWRDMYLVFCGFLLIFILGLEDTYGSKNEPDVNSLIDSIQSNYDRTHALTAEFVQVATLTSIDRRQTSAGRLFIEKPYHIRWEYTQPDSQTILYDGRILRIYTPRRQQVLQSKIDEDNRGNVALLFLAGVGKLRETFNITLLPDTEAGMKRLRLLPLSPQASFTELHIAVNATNYFIEQLTIYDTIGNLTEIRLQALATHATLPAQTFELVLPPNTEVLTPTDFSGPK
jgi:outer membrane lipoprotein carrier protein